MNVLVTRMAGVRQGMGLTVALVGVLYLAQTLLGQTQRLIPISLLPLLFGAALIVWSIEEHVRGNKVFTGVFAAIGLLVVSC